MGCNERAELNQIEVLSQVTRGQMRVANSTAPSYHHGPRGRMTSGLKSPITVSAIALS
jgi:hypothetical protein